MSARNLLNDCVSTDRPPLEARLAEFLARQAPIAWEWGEHDCATFMADWYMAASGNPDPIAAFRGSYASEAECLARWGKGHLLRHCRRVCSKIRLELTGDPRCGDIGVIELRALGQVVIIGAIRSAGGWVMRGEVGLTRLQPEKVKTLAAWSI